MKNKIKIGKETLYIKKSKDNYKENIIENNKEENNKENNENNIIIKEFNFDNNFFSLGNDKEYQNQKHNKEDFKTENYNVDNLKKNTKLNIDKISNDNTTTAT